MQRAPSIEALLRKAQTLFTDLKRGYDASLHEKHVREDLKVGIKNIFENLRSCLDYLAHDIFEIHCSSEKSPDRLYFPIWTTATEFYSDDTVCSCKNGCQPIAVISRPGIVEWPGSSYRLETHVIRNAADIFVSIAGMATPVPIPASQAALMKVCPHG